MHVCNAQQPLQQSAVMNIKFVRLDQVLAMVAVPWGELSGLQMRGQ